MSQYSILIVEDDAAALRLLEKTFCLDGFIVYTAKTCARAIKLIKKHKPDCLLSDYCLEDGTAIDVCEKVRADNDVGRTPIVILSGHAQKSLSSYTICQADFFVEKTKTCKEVLAVVKSLLRRLEWERGTIKKSDIVLDPQNLSVLVGKNRVVRLSCEQFRFFSIIFKKSPGFVDEESISKHVFDVDFSHDKSEAIRSLASRLRQKLGKQLGRRIKSNRRRGWTYVSPHHLRYTVRSKEIL